ncbi:hypothetical protein CDEST_10453 [Colletotrichum destructivum]|uniref:Uncharacterized protein n=1 Tax=Colletotrichum destructivum TaxID=34406 RepID=A0AAX4IPS5_9PEZI|nr:hypothetical protein CDEST_10453 [Colletotrichum destructivum]
MQSGGLWHCGLKQRDTYVRTPPSLSLSLPVSLSLFRFLAFFAFSPFSLSLAGSRWGRQVLPAGEVLYGSSMGPVDASCNGPLLQDWDPREMNDRATGPRLAAAAKEVPIASTSLCLIQCRRASSTGAVSTRPTGGHNTHPVNDELGCALDSGLQSTVRGLAVGGHWPR